MKLKNKINKNQLKFILILIIIAASFFLRIWKAPQFFFFGIDEEYQTYLALTLIKKFHIIWFGVNSSVGFYLAPGFTYLTAILLYISNGDPIIFSYFAPFFGLLTTISIFYIVNKLFGFRTAVTSIILYGFSAFLIFYDRRYWNPTPIPLISIWLFYSLVKSFKNTGWLILAFILIGIVYHLHLSLLIYWPFIIFAILKQFKKIRLKTWILSIGFYILITFPLLVFDLESNFTNLLMPIKFLKGTSVPGRNYSIALIPHFLSTIISYGEIWTIIRVPNFIHLSTLQKNPISYLVIVMFSIITFYILIKTIFQKKDFATVLLLYIIGFFTLGYIFFPGLVLNFYLLGCYPLIFILIAKYLNNYSKNYIYIIILLLFFIVNIYSFVTYYPYAGLSSRKNLVEITMQKLGNNSYYLTCLDCNYGFLGGWRYLFKIYGKTPSKSKIDKLFHRYYPEEISQKDPKKSIILSNGDYNLIYQKIYTAAEVGPFTSYILDYKDFTN